MKQNNEIPIFFAIDDGYTSFLAVALQSLIDNSSPENKYVIKILHTNVSEESKKSIYKFQKENVDIEFVDLNYYVEKIQDKLYTRDYYSKTTYFRLFIPELYPQYDKALYLDSDIVILADIAELYNTDVGTDLVAAIPDDIIQYNKVYQDYAELVVGVAKYQYYFNAGVLLMNLDELRKFKFQQKFLYLLGTVKFSVAQDQDYLNRLCKGRVTLVGPEWNCMPLVNKETKREDIKLVHYNFAYKPWHFEDVLYKEFFWQYAEKTEFYEEILKIRDQYTDEEKFQDKEAEKALSILAEKENSCVGDDRGLREIDIELELESEIYREIEKSPDRLKILKKIEILEEEGRFDVDPEEDPPTIELKPGKVDYLKTKSTNKLKTMFANKVGERFLNNILHKQKLLIKEIKGIENLNNIPTGAIITCNHFNPFDAFTIEEIFRISLQPKDRKLYKVIREGNYTNFPGFYGFLFRNCNTLPLSSNTKTMVEFMKAVENILNKNDFILIYPEQSLWWNYKKPRPLKQGAYKIAAKNEVPIIPIFITMQDSNKIGDDGFPVQEYTVNIEKPIYPNKELSCRDNAEQMKEKNFEIWKNIYEDFYKIPLEYTTKKEEK